MMLKVLTVSVVLCCGLATGAQAGCLTGAAVGGAVGHVAGHHALIGAAVGCAVGHHRAAKDRDAHPQGQDNGGKDNKDSSH